MNWAGTRPCYNSGSYRPGGGPRRGAALAFGKANLCQAESRSATFSAMACFTR